MKVLILGGGAREHALARALDLDPSVSELHAAPGNPGIGRMGELHSVDPMDPDAAATLATELGVDLVVVGPEAPLVAGVADAVRAAGVACFGPTKTAATLEGSKSFAKEIMTAAGVPTAKSRACASSSDLAAALDEFGSPHVVKDDGLAAGKGVVVTEDRKAALAHGDGIIAKGSTVVVEEFLDGPEVSVFCLSDGETVIALEPAQDFKRAYDDDQGLNTGGMGAYCPLPWAPRTLAAEVVQKIAQPTVAEMARRGTPFQGVLYCGLAITSTGIRVVEFNVRFGDPEVQSVLARLETPLSEVLLAVVEGRLGALPRLRWRADAAVTVVVAAHGYPGTVRSGDEITGIDEAERETGVHVLQAGTRVVDGRLISSGGRILSVVGMGHDLATARERAYAGVSHIHLEGSHFRSDIALAAANMEVSV